VLPSSSAASMRAALPFLQKSSSKSVSGNGGLALPSPKESKENLRAFQVV
jgi:hypothetical protein